MAVDYSSIVGAKVLITGGAGFVGSNLTERLLELGAEVVCLDNLSTGKRSNLVDVEKSSQFTFVEGDANSREVLLSLFEKWKFDYVFHYAATVGVIRTVENPLAVLGDIDGIKSVMELSQKYGVKKVMYASSSEVYGEPLELPEREDARLNAELPYATVKLMGEHYLRAYFEKFGLKTCSLRFFNVYGPKQDATALGFVAGVFMRQALSGQNITIFGEGNQTRDFVYIADNIEASIRALLSDSTNGKVMNIGRGTPVTIRELGEKVIEMFGNGTVQLEFQPLRKSGEIVHRTPSLEKMKEYIDFVPPTTLDEGLKKTFDWYKQNLNF